MRYGVLLNQIKANVVLGVDQYPTNLDKAYAILTDSQIQQERDRLRRSGNTNNTNVTNYAGNNMQGDSNYQSDRQVPEGENIVIGTDRRVSTVQCTRCNTWGHYANVCPQVSTTVSKKKVNKNIFENNFTSLCYILDTGSTHNIVKEPDDLTNITNLFNNKVLHMRSSTGDVMKYYKKGKHTTFGVDAYYNKDTAANILAFHTLANLKGAYMLYDSRAADCFRLIYKDGKELQFKNCGDGLYTFVHPNENIKFESNKKEQLNEDVKHNTTTQKESVNVQTQYIQTVSENKKLMSKREIERAQSARELQEYLGWPSTKEFVNIINGNEIRNINITVDDIKRALVLYGEPTQCIRGKMTRRRPMSHDTMEFLQQPLPIELHDKRIELFLDLFKFAGTWFIIIESSRIKYVDIEVMTGQGLEYIIEQVKQCIRKYKARGLQISGAHVDNQFYKSEFQRAIAPTILIPYATEEHVSTIERRIRAVKERMRAILSGLPFKKLPKVMVRGLATKVKNMINKFPVRKGGVSSTLSPEEIVEGKHKLDGNRRRINFGQYAEVHEGTTNTAANRSIGGIAMYATNARDGFAFMCIETGRCRHSNNWVEKPITEDVIAKVENLTKEGVEVHTLMSELDMIVPEDIIDSSEYIRMADERKQRHELKSREDDVPNISSMERDTYDEIDGQMETDGDDSDSNNADSTEEQDSGRDNEIFDTNEDIDHDIMIEDRSDMMNNEQEINSEDINDDMEIENESIMYNEKTSDMNNIKDDINYNNDETIPTSNEEKYEPVVDDTDIVAQDADHNLSVNMGIQEDS